MERSSLIELPYFEAAGTDFCPGVMEERSTTILFRRSNQNGAPREAAEAVRNQPSKAASKSFGELRRVSYRSSFHPMTMPAFWSSSMFVSAPNRGRRRQRKSGHWRAASLYLEEQGGFAGSPGRRRRVRRAWLC